jgi:cyclopropane-fatty-acyl-phospholipid synthase
MAQAAILLRNRQAPARSGAGRRAAAPKSPRPPRRFTCGEAPIETLQTEQLAASTAAPLLRLCALPVESALYGPLYGALKYLIRSPAPLDPDWVWHAATEASSPWFSWLARRYPPHFVRRLYVAAKRRLDHRVAVTTHYDASNELFSLILDRKYMFYSCADFITGSETLEQAQENKANDFIRLLAPRPGERILDLGCGWGGMLRRIREATGDARNLSGMTLSRAQLEFIGELGDFNVSETNFVLCDYGNSSFDKIYSIGAWEHVRPDEILPLLRKLFRALKPGGRLVQQFICLPHDRFPTTVMIGEQTFFPGSALSTYTHQLRCCEATGFRVLEQKILDYRPTLRAWFENLSAHADEAVSIVGVQRFNEFLVFFPAAWRCFKDLEGFVLRIALEKP